MNDTIRIMKRNAEVSIVGVDLFKRGKLSAKFKTKLYHEGFNNSTSYFHSEYVYRSKTSQSDRSINLSPNSFIQISGSSESKNKYSILLTEVTRNKLLRKIQKIVGIVEAYDFEEIDLILTRDGENFISNKYGETSVSVKISKVKMEFTIVIRHELLDVGVRVEFDGDYIIDLSVHDFLDLMYKIRNINFMSMTMQMINYMGRPEIGYYETDLRRAYANIDDSDIGEQDTRTESSGLESLETNPRKVLDSRKLVW